MTSWASDNFRLYAVSTRYPQKLAKEVMLTKVQAGVYETQWGRHPVRILILSEFPETPNNIFWQLFSAVPGKIQKAQLNYRHRLSKMSSFINKLFEYYHSQGVVMPYT